MAVRLIRAAWLRWRPGFGYLVLWTIVMARCVGGAPPTWFTGAVRWSLAGASRQSLDREATQRQCARAWSRTWCCDPLCWFSLLAACCEVPTVGAVAVAWRIERVPPGAFEHTGIARRDLPLLIKFS